MSTLLGMTTRFPLNGLVISTTGTHPNDKIFWRITERTGDRIRLCPTKRAFTLKGNLIPGEIDPNEKPITRRIKHIYGGELVGPVIMHGTVLGLTPWQPRKLNVGRGGKRIGAGRKKGSGTGRNSFTKGITLTADEWLQIECLRGSSGISETIRSLIFDNKKKLRKPVDGQ